MKKKNIISILLSLALFLPSFGCASCNVDDNGKIESTTDSLRVSYSGTHVFNVTETEKDFIKDGKTDYKLVVSSKASSVVVNAVTEFRYFFEKATGIYLDVIYDNGNMSHTANQKYISIGETSLLKTSGVSYDKKALGRDGIRIETKDGNIYLAGGYDTGTLYSVYAFMELFFGFEIYYWDCYTLNTGVKDLKFKTLDVTDIPDIENRAGSGSLGCISNDTRTYDSRMYGARARAMEGRGANLLPIYKEYDLNSAYASSTNSNVVLAKDIYYAEHSAWFSDIVDPNHKPQLCYTAHGDQSEFDLMTQEAAKKIIFTLENLPVEEGKNAVTITMEDNYDCCNCEKCTELAEYYGTEAGAVCIWMNRVGELVEEWLNDPANVEHYREDFRIWFFAYYNFEKAPAKYNETTKRYEPIDDKVKLRDNVSVYYAPIHCDFQRGFFDEEVAEYRENIDKWDSISDHIQYWLYFTNYTYPMYFYDTFSYFAEDTFAYIASHDAEMLFLEGVASSVDTTFQNLKFYIAKELMWDTTKSAAELTDKWFDAMFGDGAAYMREYFNTLRAHTSMICQEYGLYGERSCYTAINQKAYWPLMTLRNWMDLCDKALEAVTYYEIVNPEYYTALKRHILIEWLSPAYITLDLYGRESGTGLSSVEKQKVINRIYEYRDFLGLDGVYPSRGVTLIEKIDEIANS